MAGELGNPSSGSSGRLARQQRSNGAAGEAQGTRRTSLTPREEEQTPRARIKGSDRQKAIAGLINGANGFGDGGGDRGVEEEEQDEGGQGEKLPARGARKADRQALEQGEGHEGGDEGQSGEDAGGGGAGGDEGEGEQGVTLEELAKALKLDKKELNGVRIKVGNDELTLGAMKDLIPRLAKLDSERAEFEQERTIGQLENIDAHRQILALVDTLPERSLPPALLRELAAQQAQRKQRESALLHKARPQWSDPKYAQAEQSAMLEVGKRYGFSMADLGSILDHRQVLLLQDFAHALARIDQAKGAATRVDPAGEKRLTSESAKQPQGRDSRGRQLSKRAALSARVHELISRG